MNRNQKILTKQRELEENKDLVIAREFVDIEESIEVLKEKIDSKNNKEVLEEVRVLSEKVENLPEPKEIPEFPKEFSIKNLPEVQNVKIINFPETKAPIVNVEAPIIEVKNKESIVDTLGIEERIEKSNILLKDISKKLNVEIVGEEKKEFGKVTLVDEDGKPLKSFGGGGGGVAKYVYDATGKTINPSTSEKQDEIKTAIENINLDTSTLVEWVSSNLDMTDNTYYYFLSFIPNTTKWRINRLNKTSYVSDYATGESSISTAWTDRATQTYATIY